MFKYLLKVLLILSFSACTNSSDKKSLSNEKYQLLKFQSIDSDEGLLLKSFNLFFF